MNICNSIKSGFVFLWAFFVFVFVLELCAFENDCQRNFIQKQVTILTNVQSLVAPKNHNAIFSFADSTSPP